MTKALVVATVISAAVSAGAAIHSGMQQAEAAEFEQQQLQEQKELEAISALQEEAEAKRQLFSTIASQEVGAAAAGRSLGLGEDQSAMAIRRDATQKSTQTIRNIKLFGQSKQRQLGLGIQQKGVEASAAKTGGFLKAGASLANAGVGVAKTGFFDPKGDK